MLLCILHILHVLYNILTRVEQNHPDGSVILKYGVKGILNKVIHYRFVVLIFVVL